MAKEIVIWCTRHLELNDERVPGAEFEIALGGKPMTLDLCEECQTQFLTPLEQVLAEYGQPVTQKRGPYKTKKRAAAAAAAGATPEGWPPSAATKPEPNADGEYVCDYPGCGRAFSRPQALGRHRTSHA